MATEEVLMSDEQINALVETIKAAAESCIAALAELAEAIARAFEPAFQTFSEQAVRFWRSLPPWYRLRVRRHASYAHLSVVQRRRRGVFVMARL